MQPSHEVTARSKCLLDEADKRRWVFDRDAEMLLTTRSADPEQVARADMTDARARRVSRARRVVPTSNHIAIADCGVSWPGRTQRRRIEESSDNKGIEKRRERERKINSYK